MENPPKPLKFAPKILLAVCIGQLDDNYKKLAYKLNDKGTICNDLLINVGRMQFPNEHALIINENLMQLNINDICILQKTIAYKKHTKTIL